MRHPCKREAYTMLDVARILSISPIQVMDWLRGGRIAYFETPGGHLRITHAELEKFMSKSRMKRPEFWNRDPVKFRVLLVEDEEDLLEIIGELLKDIPQIDVHKEMNGFDAALKISSWQPDLVLLDFVIPGMTGFELCKRIREDPETADIPVLALTSLSTEENKEAVYRSGVSDFLGKPFYSEDLLQKVRTMLGIDVHDARMAS